MTTGSKNPKISKFSRELVRYFNGGKIARFELKISKSRKNRFSDFGFFPRKKMFYEIFENRSF